MINDKVSSDKAFSFGKENILSINQKINDFKSETKEKNNKIDKLDIIRGRNPLKKYDNSGGVLLTFGYGNSEKDKNGKNIKYYTPPPEMKNGNKNNMKYYTEYYKNNKQIQADKKQTNYNTIKQDSRINTTKSKNISPSDTLADATVSKNSDSNLYLKNLNKPDNINTENIIPSNSNDNSPNKIEGNNNNKKRVVINEDNNTYNVYEKRDKSWSHPERGNLTQDKSLKSLKNPLNESKSKTNLTVDKSFSKEQFSEYLKLKNNGLVRESSNSSIKSKSASRGAPFMKLKEKLSEHFGNFLKKHRNSALMIGNALYEGKNANFYISMKKQQDLNHSNYINTIENLQNKERSRFSNRDGANESMNDNIFNDSFPESEKKIFDEKTKSFINSSNQSNNLKSKLFNIVNTGENTNSKVLFESNIVQENYKNYKDSLVNNHQIIDDTLNFFTNQTEEKNHDNNYNSKRESKSSNFQSNQNVTDLDTKKVSESVKKNPNETNLSINKKPIGQSNFTNFSSNLKKPLNQSIKNNQTNPSKAINVNKINCSTNNSTGIIGKVNKNSSMSNLNETRGSISKIVNKKFNNASTKGKISVEVNDSKKKSSSQTKISQKLYDKYTNVNQNKPISNISSNKIEMNKEINLNISNMSNGNSMRSSSNQTIVYKPDNKKSNQDLNTYSTKKAYWLDNNLETKNINNNLNQSRSKNNIIDTNSNLFNLNTSRYKDTNFNTSKYNLLNGKDEILDYDTFKNLEKVMSIQKGYVDLTPIPMKREDKKTRVDQIEYSAAERAAVLIRRIEYSHNVKSMKIELPENQTKELYLKLLVEAKTIIIQRWWRRMLRRLSLYHLKAQKIQSVFRGKMFREAFDYAYRNTKIVFPFISQIIAIMRKNMIFPAFKILRDAYNLQTHFEYVLKKVYLIQHIFRKFHSRKKKKIGIVRKYLLKMFNSLEKWGFEEFQYRADYLTKLINIQKFGRGMYLRNPSFLITKELIEKDSFKKIKEKKLNQTDNMIKNRLLFLNSPLKTNKRDSVNEYGSKIINKHRASIIKMIKDDVYIRYSPLLKIYLACHRLHSDRKYGFREYQTQKFYLLKFIDSASNKFLKVKKNNKIRKRNHAIQVIIRLREKLIKKNYFNQYLDNIDCNRRLALRGLMLFKSVMKILLWSKIMNKIHKQMIRNVAFKCIKNYIFRSEKHLIQKKFILYKIKARKISVNLKAVENGTQKIRFYLLNLFFSKFKKEYGLTSEKLEKYKKLDKLDKILKKYMQKKEFKNLPFVKFLKMKKFINFLVNNIFHRHSNKLKFYAFDKILLQNINNKKNVNSLKLGILLLEKFKKKSLSNFFNKVRDFVKNKDLNEYINKKYVMKSPNLQTKEKISFVNTYKNLEKILRKNQKIFFDIFKKTSLQKKFRDSACKVIIKIISKKINYHYNAFLNGLSNKKIFNHFAKLVELKKIQEDKLLGTTRIYEALNKFFLKNCKKPNFEKILSFFKQNKLNNVAFQNSLKKKYLKDVIMSINNKELYMKKTHFLKFAYKIKGLSYSINGNIVAKYCKKISNKIQNIKIGRLIRKFLNIYKENFIKKIFNSFNQLKKDLGDRNPKRHFLNNAKFLQKEDVENKIRFKLILLGNKFDNKFILQKYFDKFKLNRICDLIRIKTIQNFYRKMKYRKLMKNRLIDQLINNLELKYQRLKEKYFYKFAKEVIAKKYKNSATVLRDFMRNFTGEAKKKRTMRNIFLKLIENNQILLIEKFYKWKGGDLMIMYSNNKMLKDKKIHLRNELPNKFNYLNQPKHSASLNTYQRFNKNSLYDKLIVSNDSVNFTEEDSLNVQKNLLKNLNEDNTKNNNLRKGNFKNKMDSISNKKLQIKSDYLNNDYPSIKDQSGEDYSSESRIEESEMKKNFRSARIIGRNKILEPQQNTDSKKEEYTDQKGNSHEINEHKLNDKINEKNSIEQRDVLKNINIKNVENSSKKDKNEIKKENTITNETLDNKYEFNPNWRTARMSRNSMINDVKSNQSSISKKVIKNEDELNHKNHETNIENDRFDKDDKVNEIKEGIELNVVENSKYKKRQSEIDTNEKEEKIIPNSSLQKNFLTSNNACNYNKSNSSRNSIQNIPNRSEEFDEDLNDSLKKENEKLMNEKDLINEKKYEIKSNIFQKKKKNSQIQENFPNIQRNGEEFYLDNQRIINQNRKEKNDMKNIEKKDDAQDNNYLNNQRYINQNRSKNNDINQKNLTKNEENLIQVDSKEKRISNEQDFKKNYQDQPDNYSNNENIAKQNLINNKKYIKNDYKEEVTELTNDHSNNQRLINQNRITNNKSKNQEEPDYLNFGRMINQNRKEKKESNENEEIQEKREDKKFENIHKDIDSNKNTKNEKNFNNNINIYTVNVKYDSSANEAYNEFLRNNANSFSKDIKNLETIHTANTFINEKKKKYVSNDLLDKDSKIIDNSINSQDNLKLRKISIRKSQIFNSPKLKKESIKSDKNENKLNTKTISNLAENVRNNRRNNSNCVNNDSTNDFTNNTNTNNLSINVQINTNTSKANNQYLSDSDNSLKNFSTQRQKKSGDIGIIDYADPGISYKDKDQNGNMKFHDNNDDKDKNENAIESIPSNKFISFKNFNFGKLNKEDPKSLLHNKNIHKGLIDDNNYMNEEKSDKTIIYNKMSSGNYTEEISNTDKMEIQNNTEKVYNLANYKNNDNVQNNEEISKPNKFSKNLKSQNKNEIVQKEKISHDKIVDKLTNLKINLISSKNKIGSDLSDNDKKSNFSSNIHIKYDFKTTPLRIARKSRNIRIRSVGDIADKDKSTPDSSEEEISNYKSFPKLNRHNLSNDVELDFDDSNIRIYSTNNIMNIHQINKSNVKADNINNSNYENFVIFNENSEKNIWDQKDKQENFRQINKNTKKSNPKDASQLSNKKELTVNKSQQNSSRSSNDPKVETEKHKKFKGNSKRLSRNIIIGEYDEDEFIDSKQIFSKINKGKIKNVEEIEKENIIKTAKKSQENMIKNDIPINTEEKNEMKYKFTSNIFTSQNEKIIKKDSTVNSNYKESEDNKIEKNDIDQIKYNWRKLNKNDITITDNDVEDCLNYIDNLQTLSNLNYQSRKSSFNSNYILNDPHKRIEILKNVFKKLDSKINNIMSKNIIKFNKKIKILEKNSINSLSYIVRRKYRMLKLKEFLDTFREINNNYSIARIQKFWRRKSSQIRGIKLNKFFRKKILKMEMIRTKYLYHAFDKWMSQIEKISAHLLKITQLRRLQNLLLRLYKGIILEVLIKSLISRTIEIYEPIQN